MLRLFGAWVLIGSPLPEKSLPLLPGRMVKRVQSKTSLRGIVEAEPPLVIGEFTDEHGTDYAMMEENDETCRDVFGG